MRTTLTKEIEGWEDFQKVKHQERRWVHSLCDEFAFKCEGLGETINADELFTHVTKALEKYPDEEFYMSDAEISRICEVFLEDDSVKEEMSRVD